MGSLLADLKTDGVVAVVKKISFSLDRRVNASIKVAALSSFAGAVVGFSRSSGETVTVDTLFGVLIGCVIACGCIAAEFGLFSNPKLRIARRLRPVTLMLLRGSINSVIIIVGLSLPGLLSDAPNLWNDPAFAEVFVISAVISYVFSVGFEVTRLLGPEATKALIWGRYTQATLENRVILFADVVGSTALAERIGQLKFHDFLRDVAQDLAEPIEKSGGEVHKYIGDSVVVTWPSAVGLANDACVTCAEEMHRLLRSRDQFYASTYATTARLRIGIHCGEVAAGEIGDWKKEIAFLGDPMNTAARIEGAAKFFKVSIAISEKVARGLSVEKRNILSQLPPFKASGKRDNLVLWEVPLT